MTDPPKLSDPMLGDVRAIAAMTGFSTPTVWRLLRDDPSFPRPRQLGRRMTRWLRSEVVDWVASRPAAR